MGDTQQLSEPFNSKLRSSNIFQLLPFHANSSTFYYFSFEVLEKAFKLCYHFGLVPDTSVEDGFEIYKFAEKYDIEPIRDYIELYLGNKITVTNFSEIINYAISINAMKLKDKCADFFIDCLMHQMNKEDISSKEIILPNIDSVNADFVAEIHESLLCGTSETY